MSDSSNDAQRDRERDRRGFLTAAAGAAAAVGAGGLVGAAAGAFPAHAHTITNPHKFPDLATYDFPGKGTVFATEPGAFFVEALKALFGPINVCLCRAPGAALRVAGNLLTMDTQGGISVALGKGLSDVINTVLRAGLNPIEHFARTYDDAVGIVNIFHSGNRPSPGSYLQAVNPLRIFQWFFNPKNFDPFDPIGTFKRFISICYPLKSSMFFNIECTVEKFPGVTLINRNPIEMHNPNLLAFPPTNAAYNIAKPCELVDKNNPKGPPLAVFEKFPATVNHNKNGAGLFPPYTKPSPTPTPGPYTKPSPQPTLPPCTKGKDHIDDDCECAE